MLHPDYQYDSRVVDIAVKILELGICDFVLGSRIRTRSEALGGGTLVRVVHEWDGPRWPLIGRLAANLVIGPHFVSAIAKRTLAGVCIAAEAAAADSAGREERHGHA